MLFILYIKITVLQKIKYWKKNKTQHTFNLECNYKITVAKDKNKNKNANIYKSKWIKFYLNFGFWCKNC